MKKSGGNPPTRHRSGESNVGFGQSGQGIVCDGEKGMCTTIGKNIVSIVLSCNNYEVIDLGVMVPGGSDCETGD